MVLTPPCTQCIVLPMCIIRYKKDCSLYNLRCNRLLTYLTQGVGLDEAVWLNRRTTDFLNGIKRDIVEDL